MIYARAILPDPDCEGRTVAIDRQLPSEDAFEAWLDYEPDAVAAILVISDRKPIPEDEGLPDFIAQQSRQGSPRAG